MYRYPINDNSCFSTLLAINPLEHSMGSSLKRYLEIKVHPLFYGRNFDKIIVRNNFDRKSGISNKEKSNKLFNYIRPTAAIEDSTLYINCFPGIDYVFHYGNILKSYASLTNRSIDVIPCLPTDEECWNVISESELKYVPKVHTVIMGYVEGLQWISDEFNWNEVGFYAWKNVSLATNKAILLGCKHTYWGEIAGRIVSYLALNGVKRIIYSGKLGTLKSNIEPNISIATGNTSILPNGEIIRWNNIFDNIVDTNTRVYRGIHITVPSVLQETTLWLDQNINNADFVDPEIGHMALAALNNNIQFSYFHVVSDNLSKKYEADLSNERQRGVIEKREELYRKIGLIIRDI